MTWIDLRFYLFASPTSFWKFVEHWRSIRHFTKFDIVSKIIKVSTTILVQLSLLLFSFLLLTSFSITSFPGAQWFGFLDLLLIFNFNTLCKILQPFAFKWLQWLLLLVLFVNKYQRSLCLESIQRCDGN